jgi:hypothetical protein
MENYLLTPNKLQPVFSRHFIFTLEGLDAFLVKRVERAPYIKPDEKWGKTDREMLLESIANKRLTVYLHEPLGPSLSQQINEIIFSPKKKVAALKILDNVGNVVGGIMYKGIEVERVDYSAFDYANNDFAEVKMTLSYREELPYTSMPFPEN